MKLLLMQPYLNLRGGVERVLLKVAAHYKAPIYTLEHNANATYLGFGDLEIRKIEDATPLSGSLPYRASQGLRYGYTFYNLRIKDDYDVINAHISPSEWARHRNERMLWYCHTPPREVYDLYHVRMKGRPYKERFVYAAMAKAYKIIAKRVVRDIERIATNSNTTRKRIEEYFSRDASVINPGVDVDEYSNRGDEKYFFYPSRVIVNKRQDYVIEAFKRFSKSMNGKEYALVLAGALSKDPEHIAYYDKIKKMAKGSRVYIKTGLQDNEIRKLYSRSTAVLFSAINEDFGFVPLEAMASGKPIISVNEGGPRETILDEKTGFLVNSPAEMASKMKFIAEHGKLAEKMGKEGRRHVSKNYTWSEFFEKFDAELRKVKDGKEATSRIQGREGT